jgi:hypothetical protein
MTKSSEALEFAKDLINAAIVFNPATVLWLSPNEQLVYDTIANAKGGIHRKEIVTKGELMGISMSYRTYDRILGRLQDNRLICRIAPGVYSTKKIDFASVNNNGSKSIVNALQSVNNIDNCDSCDS